jgi:hypothetical protein
VIGFSSYSIARPRGPWASQGAQGFEFAPR